MGIGHHIKELLEMRSGRDRVLNETNGQENMENIGSLIMEWIVDHKRMIRGNTNVLTTRQKIGGC